MNPSTGGPQNPKESQREAAIRLAREQAMAAYGKKTVAFQAAPEEPQHVPEQRPAPPEEATPQISPMAAPAQVTPVPQPTPTPAPAPVTTFHTAGGTHQTTPHRPILQSRTFQGAPPAQSQPRPQQPQQRPVQPATSVPRPQPQQTQQPHPQQQPAQIAQSSRMVPNNTDPATWNQYHSAWSNYYQQYYQQYYSKTASQVVQKAQTQAQAKTKGALTVAMAAQAAAEQERKKTAELAEHLEKEHARISRPLTPAEQMRLKIREKASEQADKIRRSHHFIPLTIGATLLLTILFLQYNRNIIAPIVSYISPGNVSAVEIEAVDPTVTTNVGPEPKLIIPKLNIDVPVFFGIPNDKASIDNAMSRGIAHFAIPGANALPGQVGNVVLSGHSASDIYSDSPFKFIFSGLPRLAERDLIYINYESRRYTYVITGTVTVAPSDVDAILIDNGKPMVTLITCVPIGTANSRLLIFAEQINPDPAAAETPTPDPRPQVSQSEMPSNPPTFFEGLWNWLSGHGWNGDENWD